MSVTRQPIPIEPIDPAVEAALGKPRSIYGRMARIKEMTQAQRRKAEFDRKRTKETYDLPAWLIEAVEMIAKKYGVPKSNVAAHLLAAGLNALLSGDIDLLEARRLTRSPRYEGILETPAQVEKEKIEEYFHGRK